MILQLQHVLPGIDKVLKKNKALQLKLSWALVLDPIGGGGLQKPYPLTLTLVQVTHQYS